MIRSVLPAENDFDWSFHGPKLVEALGETLYMVSATLLIGGLLGLALGLALYTTRRGGLLANRGVFGVANLAGERLPADPVPHPAHGHRAGHRARSSAPGWAAPP